ncbi:hypothetical protein DCAR_0833017 [Daucus carota subsp. sativus]|uniref:Uncharacterized protein n=1 Tax=Daucus carota subsp. sativus TaxID=79200 RepID=A0AAF1BDY4_DAUCS|nr:hypothetical protein DCAR_0833017 [Daucus carota subsp. sativus]
MESLKVFHADGLDFGNSSYTTQQNVSWGELLWGLVAKQKVSLQLSLTSLPCNSITSLSSVNCNLHDSSFPWDFRVSPTLEKLNLSKNPIRFLPDCFKGLEEVKNLIIYDCNQLQTLEDLPKIKKLHALRCPLLEKISLKPGLFLEGYAFPHKCEKLLEMESVFKVVPIGEIDSELINNFGIYDVESMKTTQRRLYNGYTSSVKRCPIQVPHRCESFSIFYPGSSVPIWFTYQSYVPSLSFIISNSKLRYLNACIVYKLNPGKPIYFYLIFHNITKDKMIVHNPACYGIPEGDEYMTWLSHWKFGSHEAGPGDEAGTTMITRLR